MSGIIAEPNEDVSNGHFELQNFILAQQMIFTTPSTFSDFSFFGPPPRLFQPPRLLERREYWWESLLEVMRQNIAR